MKQARAGGGAWVGLLVLASSACDEPEDDRWFLDLVCDAQGTFVNETPVNEAPQHCGECGHACSRDDMCLDGECVANRNFALWPIPPARVEDEQYELHDDTVLDRSTQLEWQRGVEDRVPDDQAVHYCGTLELDGGDWRLPTYMELLTIVDFSRRLPAINPVAFPDTPSSPFKFYDEGTIWDSGDTTAATCRDELQDNGLEYCARPPSRSSQIDFSEGSRHYDPDDGGDHNDDGLDDYVRCVRGGTPPESFDDEPHYDIEDDTVFDRYTGLRWQRNLPPCDSADACPGNALLYIEDALAYCEDLELGGHEDWRLPSITELLSASYILNRDLGTEVVMQLDPDVFPEDAIDLTSRMWSSTRWTESPDAGSPRVWSLDNLLVEITRDEGAVRARCVRSED